MEYTLAYFVWLVLKRLKLYYWHAAGLEIQTVRLSPAKHNFPFVQNQRSRKCPEDGNVCLALKEWQHLAQFSN